jgi:hypothetical protein
MLVLQSVPALINRENILHGGSLFKMKRLLAPLVLLALLVQPAAAQQPDAVREQTDRLATSILIGGRSMQYVTELADTFGGRLTGSTAYARSAEWAAARFREAGIRNVKLEPFTMPQVWERGWANARMTAPMARPLHLESLGWSPSTPAGGIRGEVVMMQDLSPEKIQADTAKLKGRIALINTAVLFAQGPSVYPLIFAAPQRLKDVGATAMVLSDNEANNVLNAFALTWGGQATVLPTAQVGQEDAKLMMRLLGRGPVNIEFQYENRLSGPAEVNNVVAEIRGREKPDEWIIIGAHLDSWDYGTGAQDNGTGSAMVLEAARAIAALGQPPRRSIRFALWGGEEEGLIGSTAYVKAHASELKSCVAVLNTDNGAGHPKGWKVEGRSDVAAALAPLTQAMLAGLGGDGISQEATFDTDHGPFMLEGIPALDLWVDMKPYGLIHHKTSDTVDKIDAHNLALGSAIVAMTAYNIAEREAPLAPHIEREAVDQIVQKTGMAALLKLVGVWK